MTDESAGPGWWQASDLKWYPPELHPDFEAPPPRLSKLPPPPEQPPGGRPPPQFSTPPPPWGEPKSHGDRNWWVALGFAALAVVATLAAAGIYFATKHSNPVATSTTPTTTSTIDTQTTEPSSPTSFTPSPPAITGPVMSGHYTLKQTNPVSGQSTFSDWYFTACGDGCAAVAWTAGGQPFGEAHVVNGQWTVAGTTDATCVDDSRVPDAYSDNFTWDPNTLEGTNQATLKVPACGHPAGFHDFINIQLSQVS